jgi:hypothetical protein
VTWGPEDRRELAELCCEHDELMARDRSELAGAPPVRREAPTGVLVYKERAAAVPSEVNDENQRNAADWDRWVKGHLVIERAEVLDIITRVLGEFGVAFVDEELAPLARRIASLEAENGELKSMLGSAVSAIDAVRSAAEALKQQQQAEKRERQIRDEIIRERSVRIADLQRENAVSHAELARQQRDQELAQRDRRIEQLETRVKMLCNFLSVGGYDLPRGL